MHPKMCLSINECADKTTLKDKVTFIIQSYDTPMQKFMLSVFSVLLSSRNGGPFEHLCVCINGPDSRTGSTLLQDKKQKFIEELRSYGWHPYNSEKRHDAPLTLIRAWSRIGKAESLEMATRWVHTNHYVFMDDNVIINKSWETELHKFLTDDSIAIAGINPPKTKIVPEHHQGMYLVRFPPISTKFLACKKKYMLETGSRLNEYFVPNEYNFLEFDNKNLEKEFFDFWGIDKVDFELCLEKYNYVWHQLGSWLYYNIKEKNLKIQNLNEKILSLHTENLENEIKKYPKFEELYRRYMEENQ